MKKLFTILCVGLLTVSLSAQTDAGTMLLEGSSNLNYSSLKVNSISVDGDELDDDFLPEDATSTLGLKVIGGYFMMDGLAVGLLIDYSSSTEGDYSSSSMTIGPIARYYIGESGMWTQLSYGIGSSSEEYDGDSEDGPSIGALGIGAGYALMLSDNVSISPSLGYSMVTATEEEGDVDVVYKAGGLVFSVGIAVHLGN